MTTILLLRGMYYNRVVTIYECLYSFQFGVVIRNNSIILGCTAICTVDKEPFRNLLQALDPRYQCPGRNHFTNKVIPGMYTDAVDVLKQKLCTIKWYGISLNLHTYFDRRCRQARIITEKTA
jgi:hypothetical protein